jgi:hypothetical protein
LLLFRIDKYTIIEEMYSQQKLKIKEGVLPFVEAGSEHGRFHQGVGDKPIQQPHGSKRHGDWSVYPGRVSIVDKNPTILRNVDSIRL